MSMSSGFSKFGKNQIKAAIFDMDGLLIDSEPLWQEAEVKIFSEVGVPLTMEMTRETMGLRADEVVEHWFSRYPWEDAPKKEIENRIIQRVIDLIQERGTLRPGAVEVIDLFARQNIPIAIASSSQTRIIEAVLEKIPNRKHIKIIHSAEYEPYGKPHPGVYITAAKKLNVFPEHCLAFEDSPNGVLSAKAARMKCTAVPDQTMKGNKIFSIADLQLDSLKDFHLGLLEHL